MIDIYYVRAKLPGDSTFHVFLCACKSSSLEKAALTRISTFKELLGVSLVSEFCCSATWKLCIMHISSVVSEVKSIKKWVFVKGQSYLFSSSFLAQNGNGYFFYSYYHFRSHSGLFLFFSLPFCNVLFYITLFLQIRYFIIPLIPLSSNSCVLQFTSSNKLQWQLPINKQLRLEGEKAHQPGSCSCSSYLFPFK